MTTTYDLITSFDPPAGLGSVFEYNGLQLNDRRSPDVIRVTSIDGLGDAELRDSRDVNPGRHGETPHSAFYGGHTITMDGEIEAGNLYKQNQLRANIRRAFVDLVERPLSIKWWDWDDDFEIDILAERYGFDAGSGTLQMLSGLLVPTTTAAKQFYYLPRDYYSFDEIFEVTTGATVGSWTIALGKRLNATNQILALFNNTSGVNVRKNDAGVLSILSSTSAYALATNTTYYFRFVGDENNIRAEIWTSPPTIDGAPVASQSWDLVGADITKFGSDVQGKAYVWWTPGATDWSAGSLSIKSFNPHDVQIDCRKGAQLAMAEKLYTRADRYVRDFQIVLRASESNFVSRWTRAQIVSPNLTGFLGRIYDRTYDLTYSSYIDINGVLIPGGTGNLITVFNDGDFESRPIIKLTGSVTNPSIRNQTTGEQLDFNGTIAAGEVWTIDVAKRTIKDAGGANRYGARKRGSKWPRVIPGDNVFQIFAEAFSGSPSMEVQYRSAWI